MFNTIIICFSAITISFVIRDTALKIFNARQAGTTFQKEQTSDNRYEEFFIPYESSDADVKIPEIPETPDKEWAGTPDNPYSPDLGSEYLHSVHAELDARIEDLKRELEYEKKQKEYVEDASKGLLFSEDADELAKQLASKVKIEVAE